MKSENNSGSSGGRSSYVPPRRLKERKKVTASATGKEKERFYSSETNIAARSSQLVGKNHCRENEGLPIGDAEHAEDGPGNLQDTVIPLKTMEDDIQQLQQRVDSFTHQVSRLLEAGKAYFLDASTASEEGILHVDSIDAEDPNQSNQAPTKNTGNSGGGNEELRNVDIVNEEIITRLREARDILEKLRVSASAVCRHRIAGEALSDSLLAVQDFIQFF